MFIRKKRKRFFYSKTEHEVYQLVENRREGDAIRQRVLFHLGEYPFHVLAVEYAIAKGLISVDRGYHDLWRCCYRDPGKRLFPSPQCWDACQVIAHGLRRKGATVCEKWSAEDAVSDCILFGVPELAALYISLFRPEELTSRIKVNALNAAAKEGKCEIIALLLEAGADPNACPQNPHYIYDLDRNRTPLSWVVESGNVEALRLLLDAGADITSTNAMDIAVNKGSAEIISLLSGAGKDPESKKKNTSEAFWRSVEHLHCEGFRVLASGGCSPDTHGPAGNTPLLLALSGAQSDKQKDFINLLLELGADVNSANDNGQTALLTAASQGYADMAALLLKNGADVNAANQEGQTALMLSADRGHPGMVKLLLEAGADVNAVSHEGQTALMLTADRGYPGIVKLLLKARANVNAASQEGQTALMLAVGHGHEGITTLLLKAKASPNLQDKTGGTALHKAMGQGSPTLVRRLLDYGADLHLPDKAGISSLALIHQLGCCAIAGELGIVLLQIIDPVVAAGSSPPPFRTPLVTIPIKVD